MYYESNADSTRIRFKISDSMPAVTIELEGFVDLRPEALAGHAAMKESQAQILQDIRERLPVLISAACKNGKVTVSEAEHGT